MAHKRALVQNVLMTSLLDNIIWNCLSGPHAKFATGAGAVRRYAPGFSPSSDALDPHNLTSPPSRICEPGEASI